MRGPLEVPVLYDFASSLCYVAHRVMQRMKPELDELEIRLVWQPLDLTRLTGWRRGDEIAGVRRENALRVSHELGVPLRMPARWMDSRAAGATALALRDSDDEPEFREGVWSAVYEHGHMLDEGTWLAELAAGSGAPLDQVAGRRGLEALDLRTLEAAEAEVSGVPTFLLDQWPVGGIQEDFTMRSLFTRYAAKKRGTH